MTPHRDVCNTAAPAAPAATLSARGPRPLPAHRRLGAGTLLSALALSLALVGCSSEPDDPASPTAAASHPPSASGTTAASDGGGSASGLPTVPGYAPGEIPPIPLFTLPDLALLGAAKDASVIDIAQEIPQVPGITVAPARCDESGKVVSGDGAVLLYGDGAGSYTGPDGSKINNGDGSGVIEVNGVSVINGGDGSGTYDDGTTSIIASGDGSGTYVDTERSITVNADGSGTETTEDSTTSIGGDGSGEYSSEGTSITNDGKGAGTYSDGTVSIINDGSGTAIVNGVTVDAAPLAPVPKLGHFPSLEALKPLTSCGVTITLADGVLFDFGKSELRPEARQTLQELAGVLQKVSVPELEVQGHTDSVSDEAFNQELSEKRAEAVRSALEKDGVSAPMTAVGYGESRPVAPNTNPDGSDNPAGRQANRRVEIFIPNG